MALQDNQIAFDGQIFTLGAIDPLELVTAVEDHFAATRVDPIEAILPALAKLKDFPAAQQRLADRAYDDLRAGGKKLDREALAKWLDTREGVSWLMWYQLKKNHPTITPQYVERIIATLTFEEAMKRRDLANQNLTKQFVEPPQTAVQEGVI